MSNNRKLVFKNNSSNKKQTISVPTIDTSLLADRERLVCLFDKIITEEKVLLGVNTLIYNANNNFEVDFDILIGDKERFILVKYIREDPSIQSTEEAFRETQQGYSKAQQYSNIKVNSTGNQFFNTNKIIKANNIINSVCTDGLYINTVTNYQILLKQTMYNKTILNYLDDFIVYYKPTDNVTSEDIETFSDLYIPRANSFPYQLKANFYGVENTFTSNKFWVLPEQFKNNGITYEIYLEGEKQRVFTSLDDVRNNVTSYILNNNILTLNTTHLGEISFFSYKRELSFTEETNGLFNNFLNFDISCASLYKNEIANANDLSYDDIIIITSKINFQNEFNEYVPSVNFSFHNNIADGLIGFYHQLDETKTIQNNQGFFNTDIMKREEQIGSFLNSLINIYWYTSILKETEYNEEVYNTGFNFTLNDPRTINEFKKDDSGKFNFIGASRTGEKDQLGSFNGKNFIYNNINFFGSNGKGIEFIECDFKDATFINCDFSGCNFVSCNLDNIISYDNSWNNFYDELITYNRNDLGFGYKFLNGSFTGLNIDISNINVNNNTVITIRPSCQTFILSNSDEEKGIKSILELSNNEFCDTYNFNSIIKVKPNVRIDISLDQLKINDKHLDHDTKEKLVDYFTHPKQSPFIFQVEEDATLEDINTINDRIKILNDNLLTTITTSNFYLTFVNYMSGNPLFSGPDNRKEYSDFYNFQFQKDLYNKNAPKIVGYKNNIDFDHSHKGTWALTKYPYNTINNKDNILSYGLQSLTDIYYELSNNDLSINDLDSNLNWPEGYYGKTYTNSNGNMPLWIKKNGGPLPYYRLDTRYTHKYFKHPIHDINFGRFRIKIGNNNYKFTDHTSLDVLNTRDRDFFNMKSNAFPDLSNNPEENITYAENQFLPDYSEGYF